VVPIRDSVVHEPAESREQRAERMAKNQKGPQTTLGALLYAPEGSCPWVKNLLAAPGHFRVGTPSDEVGEGLTTVC